MTTCFSVDVKHEISQTNNVGEFCGQCSEICFVFAKCDIVDNVKSIHDLCLLF